MKIASTTALFFILSTTVTSLSLPQRDLAVRDDSVPVARSHEVHDLEKRRGGGGRGGGGGGGRSGGGGGGRSGSSGGSSSSSSSSRSSSSSNQGGSTRSGSGRQPAYGGGYYYGGGATAPYAAGSRSRLGVFPFLLPVAALAFFPGIWLYGAYAYPYSHHYNYVNETNHQNESLPVVCLCEKYSECGCDDNNNSTYYESLFNGTQPANSSIVKIAEVNGTETIYINGTLPNGTTVADPSASSASTMSAVEFSGYWMMVAAVAGTVWGL
ncbi:hypothetical protein FE257_004970 [Aspergillus nanangensis]|uniref:DUF7732 domain-containing protein n=1 Tax=Aspergillus nanangensis TaxID=2582783 RepID=A0AAD4GM89_ASPNN|nr:hypothetical protein FE257_004970 [Aspergillus nanangensis]